MLDTKCNEVTTKAELDDDLFEYRLQPERDHRHIHALLLDYRAARPSDFKHPFVVALYNLALKTSWAFARKKEFPAQGADLFEAVWLGLLETAERDGGQLLAGHDPSLRSVASYLWALERIHWARLSDQWLDEESDLLAQEKGMTKAQARAQLAEQLRLHAQDPAENPKPQFGCRMQSLDDLSTEEPAAVRWQIPGLAGDRWAAGAALGGKRVPPSVNPADYRTPLQSPIRISGLANAFEELGQAMVGLKSKGKSIGTHELQAWNAFWAAARGFDAYADVAVEELATRLDYDTKSKFLTVLFRTIDLWLNPPEDEPKDSSELQQQKTRVRVLSDHCLRLALPSRLIGTATPEDVQKYIGQARALLQGKKADLGFQPLQQFRSRVQRDFSEALLRAA